ncbi:MAG: helix-turn-helix transcriptional regulator [Eubacterium sp.]|nr:helix-turn-helix transcriptional regulator [Eubacterium sp.]
MIRILLSSILGEKRITQAKLSQMTGIRPNTINELYHEYAERVSIEHLDKLCKTLDVDLSELIKFVPDDSEEAKRRPRH